MNTDEILNEPRSTFEVRRAMIFGIGVAAVRSILPDVSVKADSVGAPNSEPDLNPFTDLILEEVETPLPPIRDCTLIKNIFTGGLDVVELEDLDDEKLREKKTICCDG